jgi:uncharacterized protein (TIGR02118 family)
MTAKLVVLYPHPVDPPAFERAYHTQHMPLMRRLISPSERTPTFRVLGRAGAPFYRMAEVHFASYEELSSFFASPEGEQCRLSSQRLSSGGPPVYFVCQPDAKA